MGRWLPPQYRDTKKRGPLSARAWTIAPQRFSPPSKMETAVASCHSAPLCTLWAYRLSHHTGHGDTIQLCGASSLLIVARVSSSYTHREDTVPEVAVALGHTVYQLEGKWYQGSLMPSRPSPNITMTSRAAQLSFVVMAGGRGGR